MTKDLKTIEVSIETRDMLLHDMFEDVSKLMDKTEEKTQKLVAMLKEQKDAVGHGNWLEYLHKSFGSNAAVQRVQRFMRKGSESKKSLLIYLDDETKASRAAIKPANVVVTTPNEITETVADDDPTPDPPTNRKTAKGSEKVPEDKKPKTQAIVPEILPDDQVRWPETAEEQIQYVLDRYALQEILNAVVAGTTSENAKRIANLMRKSADKLDPPDETKAKVPTASALRATVDGGTMSEEMMLAIHDWVNHKQNNPDKVYKYKSIESWKKDLKRILSVAQRSGEPFVIEALDKAESKGWRGWEQNEQNGKANGNGRRTTETNDPSSCLGPNGRPRVERAKINYK